MHCAQAINMCRCLAKPCRGKPFCAPQCLPCIVLQHTARLPGHPWPACFSDNKKQPWFLDSGYLAGLSPGAVEFFERFRRVFEGRIAAAATFKNGDGRWIAEVKEFASAQGVDGSLLAKM